MPHIEIDDQTFEQLDIAARLTDTTPGELVARLLARITPPSPATGPAPIRAHASVTPQGVGVSDQRVAVYSEFKGHRVEGRFDVSTHELEITSVGPWRSRSYSSPTAAAEAVVEAVAGTTRETANTNGRIFWKRSDGRGNLRSLIGQRS